MGQFVKVGTTAEFEDLEGESLWRLGARASPFLIWVGATTPSRILVLIEVDPWPRACWQARRSSVRGTVPGSA